MVQPGHQSATLEFFLQYVGAVGSSERLGERYSASLE